MNRSQVSIIIPIYNGKDYIKSCLDSILAQKYDDWECIIIDDGSTDGSNIIIDKYVDELGQKEHFHILHQTNSGVSAARNAGLDMAQGEWICFVDIDDGLSEDFLNSRDFETDAELIVKNIRYKNRNRQYHHLNAGIYSGDSLIILLSTSLFHSHFLCPWTKFFRRSIIKEHGIAFNPKYKFGEDTLFVLSYLKHITSLYVSPKGEYLYLVTAYNKYKFSVTKAIEYMHDFSEVFFSLGLSCPEMAKRVLIWHSGFCSDFKGINKLRWYSDPSVNKLYRHAYKLFPSSVKANILGGYLLSLSCVNNFFRNRIVG